MTSSNRHVAPIPWRIALALAGLIQLIVMVALLAFVGLAEAGTALITSILTLLPTLKPVE